MGWSVLGTGGQEHGPYSWAELMDRLLREEIGPSDRVRQGAEDEWAPLAVALGDVGAKAPEGAAAGLRAVEEQAGRRSRILGWGLLVLLVVPFLAAIIAAAIKGAGGEVMARGCAGEMTRMGEALRAYAADHDGRFPYTRTWEPALAEFLGRRPPLFVCPATRPDEPSYALNPGVAGTPMRDCGRPDLTVLAADASLLMAAPGGERLPPRHQRGENEAGENVLMVDGHVRFNPRPAPASP